MALPRPYAGADDGTLVDGCLRGDADAWAALRARFGTLLHATVVRAAGGARGPLDDEGLLELVWAHLGADGGAPLRHWSGECQLRSYLAIVGRHVAIAHAEVSASPAAAMASMPTPSGLFLDDLLAAEPASRVAATLEKLPPNIDALVRLRLRGLSRADIAATLGTSPASVAANLERVARRLGELDGDAETGPAWRVLLDAATVEERVAQAVRTEDDPDYRAKRALVEKTWRAVAERALARPALREASCLDERATAGFVDGTLRGPGRARAEGHVATCPRCIDEAAALVLDLKAFSVLRDTGELDSNVAVAAACVATARFTLAERLADRAISRAAGGRAALDLKRLAQAGRLVEKDGGRPREQASQVVPTRVPDDDEALLVAFEALVLSDVHAAWRAIDDRMAKHPIGARLRLLAAASGQDLEAAHALAARMAAQPALDPGRARDARAVAALPKGRALPRENLIEHLCALLPDAVRYVLSRAG